MRYAGFEKVYKAELNEIRNQGISQGRKEGREEGRAEGKEEGRIEGRAEGRAEGKAETKLMDIEGIINAFHVTLEAACKAVGITMNEYMGMKDKAVQRSA